MKLKRVLLLAVCLLCVMWCASALAETPVCGTEGSEYSYCWPDYSERQYDDNFHWYACENCGSAVNKVPHYSRCNNIGECYLCDAPYTGKNVSNHYATCLEPDVCVWCRKKIDDLPIGSHGTLIRSSDDEGHWYTCDLCGEVVQKTVHYVMCDAEDNTVCYVCDAAVTGAAVDHWWDGYVPAEDGMHTRICDGCGLEEEEAHWAYCDSWRTDICDACDESVQCEVRHADVTSNYLGYDESSHWYTCYDCDEKLDVAAHYTNEDDTAGICSHCGAAIASVTGQLMRLSDTAAYYDQPGGTAQFTYADLNAVVPKNLLDYYGEPVVSGGYTWYQVKENGGLYYLRSDAVKVLGQPDGYVMVYSYETYLRNEPAGNRVLDDIYYENVLPYFGQPVQSVTEDPWYLVTYGGMAGYVRGNDVAPCDIEGNVILQDPATCKHNYGAGSVVGVDEYYHADTCFLCGAPNMDDLSTHHASCQSTACDICKAENVIMDTFWHYNTTNVKIDKKQHGEYCLDCETVVSTAKHSAYCDTKVCMDCGEEDCELQSYWHRDMDYVSVDENTHAYSCLDCGYVSYTEEHTSTCTEPNVCRWCYAEYEGIEVTRHENTEYKYDATHHWWECKDCGELAYGSKWEHYSSCEEPDVCSDCGVTYDGSNVEVHSEIDWSTYHYDADYHWFECMRCGGQAQKSEHRASCSLPGVCDYCLMGNYTGGKVFHDFEYSYGSGQYVWKDYTSHDYYCSWCGEFADTFEHWAYYNEAVCEECEGRVADPDALLIIPEDTTVINAQAFYGATSVKDVILPEGLKTIESLAFAASSVRTVNLPSTLESIADDAFDGCNGITGVMAEEGTYAYTWAQEHGLID